ncbi:Uncharacterised protein [Enterobacter asburiae]|uniref:Uncharacterized protein n=1 Tax=Enterobacter asburiae TaxID=61645 RepID=A0A376FKT8_ENTAS|nr:Uncharacterised protein [Enterobacter asburiae]
MLIHNLNNGFIYTINECHSNTQWHKYKLYQK